MLTAAKKGARAMEGQPGAIRPRRTAASCSRRAPRRRRDARGFTLIEASMTIVIVSVAVLAMVASFTAYHQKNQWATRVATATWLANEIREATFALPRHDPVTGDDSWGPEINEIDPPSFDDGDDFDGDGNGCIFTDEQLSEYDWTSLGYTEVWTDGPRNARLETIPGMDGWTQLVRVFSLDPFNIAFHPDVPASIVLDGTSDVMGIAVTVYYRAPREVEPQVITETWFVLPQ